MTRVEPMVGGGERAVLGGVGASARRATVSDYVELTKPGIVKMVVITAGVGFALGALGRG